jgi:hypothetical protein
MRQIYLKDAFKRSISQPSYAHHIKEFVHGFGLDDMGRISRFELIKDEPDFNAQPCIHEIQGYCITPTLLVSTIEHLCDIYDVRKPEWIFRSDYILPEAVFANANPKVQKIDYIETPTYYRKRNLYCGKILGDIVTNHGKNCG